MSTSALPIVVYGAGGHGRVLLDLLVLRESPERLLGFLDDQLPVGESRAGLPVLGGLDWLAEHRDVTVALGIGQNQVRARIAQRCHELGVPLFTAVHPQAVVSSSCEIGAGTVVFAAAVINAGAWLGRGCIVNSGAVVEHDCKLGDFSHLSPNATLGGAADVGSLAHVGLAACVLPGVRVGEAAVVGAGSVVNRAIPDRAVAYGVPARVQRSSQ